MTSGGQLQHFIEQTQRISAAQTDLSSMLDRLQQWQQRFAHGLSTIAFDVSGLQPVSTLAQQIALMNQQVIEQIRLWDLKWAELAEAQSVADAFHDKVMLLVFGKFNAGKSSLCNLLAECFRRQGQSVRYFYVQHEQIHYSEALLREGATETTAQLQGVCLGERLVLLDTPGLHSATAENAALTQRFIDSADGMLWLSSSTSPGQVQELHALARELKRHKPLFPVITRSDQVEEDEVDGEICTVLCNKPVAQRRLQEADVKARAEDKLREMAVDVHLLKAPVSISTQMARQADMNQKAMTEAGFERLFAALLEMIQPALCYKQRKPAEVFLHHLQEQVLEAFVQDIQPISDQVQLSLHHMQTALLQQQRRIAEQVWKSVLPELPQLLEQHASTQAIDQVYTTLNQWLAEARDQHVQQQLADYRLHTMPHIQLEAHPHLSYERVAGIVTHDRLYAELCRQINDAIKHDTDQVISQCEQQLSRIEQDLQQLQALLVAHGNDLNRLASDLRQY
ncbi:dynamin family protein [Acinetobacter ihumii]|uniref:dynamin family protein n=1 Tax=Acinetobacter ihumii TaxID=2483802 RepID=UPI001030D7C2|nr:dynamin family protein [Acinetobacter ihumii]